MAHQELTDQQHQPRSSYPPFQLAGPPDSFSGYLTPAAPAAAPSAATASSLDHSLAPHSMSTPSEHDESTAAGTAVGGTTSSIVGNGSTNSAKSTLYEILPPPPLSATDPSLASLNQVLTGGGSGATATAVHTNGSSTTLPPLSQLPASDPPTDDDPDGPDDTLPPPPPQPAGPLWDAEDVRTLRDLLEVGERAKWKHVATELTKLQGKRIPAVACQKKFKDMFGVAEASSLLGSSLCYVVARDGWACLDGEGEEDEGQEAVEMLVGSDEDEEDEEYLEGPAAKRLALASDSGLPVSALKLR